MAETVDLPEVGGGVDKARFYESPFSNIDGLGVEGVFSKDQASDIIQIVRARNETADAAWMGGERHSLQVLG